MEIAFKNYYYFIFYFLVVHNALELLDSGNSSQLSITEEISDKIALIGISKNGHKQHRSKKK